MDTNSEPLKNALEGYFDKPSAEVPEGPRAIFDAYLPPGLRWNDLSPYQRQQVASERDNKFNPELKQVRDHNWKLFWRLEEIKDTVQALERMQPTTPLDFESQHRQIALYQQELDRLNQDWRGLEHAKTGHVGKGDRYAEARKMAREMAQERWEETAEQVPRIGQVAKDIHGVIAADPDALGLKSAPKVETVRKWIKGLAPTTAIKGGRPRKPGVGSET